MHHRLLGSALLTGLSLGPATAAVDPPGGHFAGLYFVDVGQGGCLLVVGADGTAVAVDAGPPAAAESISATLTALEVDRIDLWVLTHLDTDHVGGLARVVWGLDQESGTADDLEVGTLWDRGPGAWPDTPAVRAYASMVGTRNTAAPDGARWTSSTVTVQVIAGAGLGDGAAPDAENERGHAYCIDVDGRRVFAPGDLPADRVVAALARCSDPDLVWVSHHGATDGTSPAVVAASGDAVAVITAGHRNPYCHPDPLTLAAWVGHRVYVSGASAVDRAHGCGEVVRALGPEHRVVGDDLVFPTTMPTIDSTSVSGVGNAVTLGAW